MGAAFDTLYDAECTMKLRYICGPRVDAAKIAAARAKAEKKARIERQEREAAAKEKRRKAAIAARKANKKKWDINNWNWRGDKTSKKKDNKPKYDPNTPENLKIAAEVSNCFNCLFVY